MEAQMVFIWGIGPGAIPIEAAEPVEAGMEFHYYGAEFIIYKADPVVFLNQIQNAYVKPKEAKPCTS